MEVHVQKVQGEFFRKLHADVSQYFSENGISEKGNTAMKVKTFSILLAFFLCYLLLYILDPSPAQVLLVYATMGIISALILINISHDAAHDLIFETAWLNRMMSYSFNLLGSNEYFWRITHNIAHHEYPNVADTDPDVDQGPFVRLSPALPLYWFHRFQHIYASFLYCLFGLYLVFVKDFRLLWLMPKIGYTTYKSHPIKQVVILFVSKFLFLGYIIVLPMIIVQVHWGYIALGFVLFTIFQSVLVTAVTAPVHVTTYTHFNNQLVATDALEMHWASRQVETTTDFLVRSPVLDFVMGGSNYQVLHHLFPHIAHTHFRQLNKYLVHHAKQFGIAYRQLPFNKAYRSHLKQLKFLGQSKGDDSLQK